jgi:hypothetical protein
MNFFIRKNAKITRFSVLLLLISPLELFADGAFIDKVYHPYVYYGEKEFELRWLYQKDNDLEQLDGAQTMRLAYGQSISEKWFGEIYVIGEKNPDKSFHWSATELEALYQITEQGEFFADWGILFEIEHEHKEHITEIAAALIIEKEWYKWSATTNLYLIYEWGQDIDNELETAGSAQLRYRYSRFIEPAIEFYSSDSSEGVGPVLMGNIKLSGRQKLHWETGIIHSLDRETPDQTFKFALEYEF